MVLNRPAQRQPGAQKKQRQGEDQSETPNNYAMHQATSLTKGESSCNPATKGQRDDGKQTPSNGCSHTDMGNRIGVGHGLESRQTGTNRSEEHTSELQSPC